jgi:hypothetical protein
MNSKDLKDLKITGEIHCAPKPYQGLPDLSDDPDVSAGIMFISKSDVIAKFKNAINCEEDYVYGPSTSYKGRYSYNRDA